MNTNALGAVAGLVLLAGAGYWLIAAGGDEIPEDIAYGNGRIEAVQIDVSTKIAGRVESVAAKEGDLVRPGDPLARIDSAQLQAQLLRAEADVASAESQVAAAEAAIAQAEAQLVLAEQELARTRKLVERGHDSQETLDARVSNRDVAEASLRSAKATHVARQRGVDAAKAVVEEIKTQIADCALASPALGRVLYRLAEPGEVLGSGGKVLTLVDLSDLYMEIFLPAAEAMRVSLGAEARVRFDLLDVAVPATVSFVSPEAQFTPKQVETPSEREKLMFRVKVRVPSDLVMQHIDMVKTGVRGVAYVRLDSDHPSEWPEALRKLPKTAAAPAAAAN